MRPASCRAPIKGMSALSEQSEAHGSREHARHPVSVYPTTAMSSVLSVPAGVLTIAVSAALAMALGAGTMPAVRGAIGVRSDVVVVLGDSGAARVVAAVVAAACDLLGIGERAVSVAVETPVAGVARHRSNHSPARTMAPVCRMGPGLHHLDLPPPAAC